MVYKPTILSIKISKEKPKKQKSSALNAVWFPGVDPETEKEQL